MTAALPVFPAAATPYPSAAVTDPAALVHPLDGTGTGAVSPGTVGEFPGADTPFGMIQWSPDTSPNAVQSGGGYDYADTQINGFSLTHLSGTGCPSYQDVPILPTVGAIGSAAPTATTAAFSHQDESATPGRYQVELNGPDPIGVNLAVTTRTGIASFDFPTSGQANLLFKVGDGVNPVVATNVRVVGHDEVEGSVTNGQFCGTGPITPCPSWPNSSIPSPRPGLGPVPALLPGRARAAESRAAPTSPSTPARSTRCL